MTTFDAVGTETPASRATTASVGPATLPVRTMEAHLSGPRPEDQRKFRIATVCHAGGRRPVRKRFLHYGRRECTGKGAVFYEVP
ncbi:hypothetical protein GCM10010094_93640 [Streptomyces flaveus]|uniref:Uncharacterized protein n=1 Tax=Streptomyces flaveus TaxID=66370 RepID=A0A917RPB0_9ACTN|nr:hypothetical protein GCM10010094_93640 [Streptomyces flaveus]